MPTPHLRTLPMTRRERVSTALTIFIVFALLLGMVAFGAEPVPSSEFRVPTSPAFRTSPLKLRTLDAATERAIRGGPVLLIVPKSGTEPRVVINGTAK